jgi:TolB-like protein/DNA-binding winged helix-turn-helix (wHTH) protein
MDNPSGTSLLIGAWRLNLPSNEISHADSIVRLDPRLMRLLLCLAERPGEIVSTDDLLKRVWNEVIVTPDSVYQAIAALRRALGDDPKNPAYIATVPRVGYRLIAAVGPADAGLPSTASARAQLPFWRRPRRGRGIALGVAALAVLLVVLAIVYQRATVPTTVAVLPFLDLTTEAMDQEYFADGMTEELIDRLSKVRGLRVSSASASFYFKGKKMPVSEIAKALGATYLLDGSLRESGSTLRVAARLLRAKDGFVVWTETYDRNPKDQLQVQDEIANEVVQALRKSIGTGSSPGT